jgi:hypothetical protein
VILTRQREREKRSELIKLPIALAKNIRVVLEVDCGSIWIKNAVLIKKALCTIYLIKLTIKEKILVNQI